MKRLLLVLLSFFNDATRVATGEHAKIDSNRRVIGSLKILFTVGIAIAGLLIGKSGYEGIEKIADTVSSQAIQMNVGVYDNIGAFVKSVDAQPGDEVLVQMSFRNLSGTKFDNIAAHVVLPPQLEYVNGSTTVFNRTNPKGLPNDDGIASEWIGLGGYRTFSEDEYGFGSVSFRVRVVDDTSLYVKGVNTLNLTCELAGYRQERIASDAYVGYCAVHVINK